MKRIYKNETDWFVAESLGHAKALCMAYYTCPGCQDKFGVCGWSGSGEDNLFEECPGDEKLTITYEGTKEKTTKTCGEWAVESDIGMLCSTEW